MQDTPSGMDLLNAATSWYRTNGLEPIPKDGPLGDLGVSGDLYHTTAGYSVGGSVDALYNVPARLIPFLAGVSLGMDSISLAQILVHHDVSIMDVSYMDFANPSDVPFVLHHLGGKNATGQIIHIEISKAFSIHDDLKREFARSYTPNASSKTALGYMHAIDSSYWPVNQIEEHAKSIMSEGTRILTLPHNFAYLASRPEALSDLPNGSPMEFFRRSGMLSDVVSKKLTCHFSMWEEFLHAATSGNPQSDMLKSLNSVTSEATVDKILQALLSVTADSYEDHFEPDDVLRLINETFEGNSRFDSVLNSVTLKLNLFAIDEYELGGLSHMTESPELYTDILDHQESLVSKVATEILAKHPSQVGYSEFMVIKKLNSVDLPPQILRFTPEDLVAHIIESIQSFTVSGQIDSLDKREMDRIAREALPALANLLSRHHTFDYEKFQHYPEETKVQLVKGGFDIKQFKDLGRRAKGDILEDSLGI